MVGVPAARPVTTPELLMDPWPGLLLLQVPPEGVAVSVVVSPTHTLNVPDGTEGIPLTVTVALAVQPVLNV